MIKLSIRISAVLCGACLVIAGSSVDLLAQGKKGEKTPTTPVTNTSNAGRSADAVVLEVGREKFTVGQIAEAFQRNANRGGRTFYDLSRDSAMAFLSLFADYRLKVQAALDAGVDKRAEVVEDLRMNRIQLAVPPPPNTGFLIERKVVDPAVERIFKRRDDELLLSLIYVAMRPNDPADTLRALRRAENMLRQLQSGADFHGMARDSSEDPSTKDAGGRLPTYVTAGMILPEIENAAYELRSGQIYPSLIRVPAGYVLLKVIDRSPRYKVRGAHILISAPEDFVADSPQRKKAEEILARIRKGEDFAKLAKEFSDDRVSADNGGDFITYYTRSLGFESRNAKLEPEIEAALFNLKDGETSGVIKSVKYGYHILKRLDSRRPTFEEEKETIRQFYKQRLMAEDRAAYVRSVVEKHGLKINQSTFDQVMAALNRASTTTDTAWAGGIGAGLRGETLFSYDGKSYSVGAWIDTVRTRPDLRALALTSDGVRNSFYTIFEQPAMVAEAKNLEQEYPEFARLMQEFRDGILIFNLEDEIVWKRLNSGFSDEKGRAFFEKNRGKYMTAPRLALREIFLFKEEEVKDMYEKARSGSIPFDTLAANFTQRQGYRERAGEWPLSNARNSDLVKQVLDRKPSPKAGEILEPFAYQGGWSIIKVENVETPRPMTYEEAKPEVQGDFIDDLQRELASEWLSQLRLKYRVKVDEKTLKSALAAK